jgi:tetratricopeptide (TPR) repeat protein
VHLQDVLLFETNTSIMNDVIVLNNNAIAYLQLGNFYDACRIMTQASSILILQTQDIQIMRRKKCRDCTISWTKVRSCKRDSTNNTKRDENPTIYPYAPTLIKPCCQKEFCTEKQCCRNCKDDADVCPSNITPVVWYNLGLCCQLLGSDLGHHTKEGLFYFSQATRLYEKVYSSCGSERPSHGLSTMKMAVLNNQGGIYFEMGKQEACSNVMRSLSDILASISQSFLCRRWDTFYLNLMVLDVTPRPAAAA